MMALPATWPPEVLARTKMDVYSREVAANLSMKLPWAMTEDEWKVEEERLKKQQEQQALQEGGVKAAPELAKQIGGQIQ